MRDAAFRVVAMGVVGTGSLPLAFGALMQEVIEVFTVVNALRAAALRDAESSDLG